MLLVFLAEKISVFPVYVPGLRSGDIYNGKIGGLLLEVDAQTEALELVEEHVERLGDAGGRHRLTLDDCLVSLGAAGHVVRLDGQDLLEDVGGAECFERPDFHLSEALSTKLRLTSERLLGNQRVRADRAGMHLVLDHMAEFEHIDHTHGGGLVETLAGAAVVEVGLSITGNACLVGPFVEVFHRRTVENRGGELLAQLAAGPSEYGLENLSEVHTRGHTKRVEADVDRSTVGEERHVFLAHDARHDTLVTVAAGHLVADTDLALLGDVDLGYLDDAGGQLVTDGDVKLLAAQLCVDFLRLAEVVDDGLTDEVVLVCVGCPLRQVDGVVVDAFQH